MMGERTKEQTGEQLFLHYAWPCADAKLASGEINQGQFLELERLIKNNEQPPRELLLFCFTNAVRRQREFAKANELKTWAPGTVQVFWRYHHNDYEHQKECQVHRCAVEKVDDTKTVVVCEGERFNVINFYNLPLRDGQVVFVHRRVVVEIKRISSWCRLFVGPSWFSGGRHILWNGI